MLGIISYQGNLVNCKSNATEFSKDLFCTVLLTLPLFISLKNTTRSIPNCNERLRLSSACNQFNRTWHRAYARWHKTKCFWRPSITFQSFLTLEDPIFCEPIDSNLFDIDILCFLARDQYWKSGLQMQRQILYTLVLRFMRVQVKCVLFKTSDNDFANIWGNYQIYGFSKIKTF